MSAATEPDRVGCVVTHYGQQTRQSGSLMDPLACYLSERYIALTEINCKGREFLKGARVEMTINCASSINDQASQCLQGEMIRGFYFKGIDPKSKYLSERELLH